MNDKTTKKKQIMVDTYGVSRRDVIKGGLGFAGMMSMGSASGGIVKSMLGCRQGMNGNTKLPYDAEVEYLESTGTQYINTGIVPNNNLGFILDIAYVGEGGTYGRLFGTQANGYSGSLTIRRYNPSSGDIQFQSIGTGINGKYESVPYDTNRKVYGINEPQGSLTVSGSVIVSDMAISSGITYSAWLFGTNNVAQYGLAKLYSFKVLNHSNGSFVADMIPVRFTNELGQSEGAMYDRVSGQIFRNQGTGAFLYGRDINPISARSYVNDGLIAMWDGIENAGWGVHDPNATMWKDLVGDNDFAIYGIVNSNGIKTTNTAAAEREGYINGIETVEVCCGIDKVTNQGLLFYSATISTSRIGLVHYGPNVGYQTYANKFYAYDSLNSASARTITGTSDGCYVNAVALQETSHSSDQWNNSTYTGVGGRHWQSNNWMANGTYHCIRIYNRALSTAEIAANYTVDRWRFNLP